MNRYHSSILVCTKDRASQLEGALASIGRLNKPNFEIQIVVVDNGSTDQTQQVVESFASVSPFPCEYLFFKEAGSAKAKNYGLPKCASKWIIFSDDDCYFDQNYLLAFEANVRSEQFAYGSGQILLYDQEDDPRVANLRIENNVIIPANIPLLRTGVIQGANMFFNSNVFVAAGVFNPLMGAGTPFPCEDIEMAARASMKGFVGAQIKDCIVFHHHRRKKQSLAAEEAIKGYDYGRGAYFASLLMHGKYDVWIDWHKSRVASINVPESYHRYLREMSGASKYLLATNGVEQNKCN